MFEIYSTTKIVEIMFFGSIIKKGKNFLVISIKIAESLAR